MEKEIWKPIPNTNNKYEASNLGNIRSFYSGKPLIKKQNKSKKGYMRVRMLKKTCNVHRLILKAFKPVPNDEKLVVNHIDGNKSNNNINNLEWCTQKYNIFHSNMLGKHYVFTDNDREKCKEKRLNSLRKKVLCIETQEIFVSISAAARAKNTYVQSICNCCNKKIKSAGGYHWMYAA